MYAHNNLLIENDKGFRWFSILHLFQFPADDRIREPPLSSLFCGNSTMTELIDEHIQVINYWMNDSMNILFSKRLLVCFVVLLIDWLIDWFIDWLIDWCKWKAAYPHTLLLSIYYLTSTVQNYLSILCSCVLEGRTS